MDDVSYLRETRRASASGYILSHVHSAMTEKLLQKMDTQAEAAKTQADPWASLSERERDALCLVALSNTNAEIAGDL